MSTEMIQNIQNSTYLRSSGNYNPSPGGAVSAPAASSNQALELKAAEHRAEASTEAQKSNQKPAQAVGSDISLRFQVDPDTNQITVLVLDRASEKVIRTIPAEEMNKLSSGEILSLFA